MKKVSFLNRLRFSYTLGLFEAARMSLYGKVVDRAQSASERSVAGAALSQRNPSPKAF